MASRSQFQFWKSSNSTWVTAEHNDFNAVIGFTINDALDNPKFLEITLNNSPNDPFGSDAADQKGPFSVGATNALKEFQRCRIKEPDTGNILFYGKIYRLTDQFDMKYGQLLRIIAYDNLQELADYPTIDKEDGFALKNTKRSAIIKRIINSTSDSDSLLIPTTNILTTGSMFEDSVRTPPNNETPGKVYINTGKNRGLTSILEIAKVDPHQASGEETSFGYDYYLTDRFDLGTSTGNHIPAQDFNYFKRGSRPAVIESNKTNFKGLRIEYPTASFAETGSHRLMLTDYSFDRAAEEIYTHGIINTTEQIANYDASTGVTTQVEQRKHLKCEILKVNFGSSNSAFQWSGKAFDNFSRGHIASTDVAELIQVQYGGTWYPIGRIQYQSGTVGDGHIIISYQTGMAHETNMNTYLAANVGNVNLRGATTNAACTTTPSTDRSSNVQTVVRPLNLQGQGVDETDGLRRKLAAALTKSKSVSIKGSMRMLQTPYTYIDTYADSIVLGQPRLPIDAEAYGFKLGMTIAKLDSEGTVTAYGYASAISTTSGVTTITNTLNTGNWTSYTGSSNKIRLYMPIKAGHYIHATNRLQNIDGYHFVNEVVYSEGEAISATQFNTLSTQASDNTTIGIGLPPGAINANIENRTAPMGATRDNFAIAALPWTLIPDNASNTTNVIASSDYDTITVASSILSLGNGMYQYDISSHTLDVTANHTIIYFDKDVSTTQFQIALKQSYKPASNHVVIGWAKAVSNVNSDSRAILHIGTGAVGADGTIDQTSGATVSQTNTTQIANDSITAAHLKASARPWTTNIEFKGTAWNAIKWFKGQNDDGSAVGNETTDATLEFANGHTLTLTAEASNSHATGMSAGTTYYMIISGTMADGSTKPVTRSTDYTDALADTTILLAIITTGSAYTNDSSPGSGQSPNILPFNSKSPTINAIAIASDSITTDVIQAGAITADQIAANTITADEMDAGSIKASHILIRSGNNGGIGGLTAGGDLDLGYIGSGNLDNISDGSSRKSVSANEKTGAGRAYGGLNSDDRVSQPIGSGEGAKFFSYGSVSNGSSNSAVIIDNLGIKGASGMTMSGNDFTTLTGGTTQFSLSAVDGKATAGAGKVILDNGGIHFLVDTSVSGWEGLASNNAIKWHYGNSLANALTGNYIGIKIQQVDDGNSNGFTELGWHQNTNDRYLQDFNQMVLANFASMSTTATSTNAYMKLPSSGFVVGNYLKVSGGSGTIDSPYLTDWDSPGSGSQSTLNHLYTTVTGSTSVPTSSYGTFRYTTDSGGTGDDTLAFAVDQQSNTPSSSTTGSSFFIMGNRDVTGGNVLFFDPIVSWSGAKNSPVLGYYNAFATINGYYMQAGNGSAAYPTITFYGNNDNGFWHNTSAGTGTISMSLTGTEEYQWAGSYFRNLTDADLGTSLQRWDTVYGVSTNMSSDIRLKENIVDMTNGLDIVNALKPIEYTRIPDESKTQHFGFSSQHVKEVMLGLGYGENTIYSEKYSEEEDDTDWGINLPELIAPLVSAIQELSAKVKKLEEEK